MPWCKPCCVCIASQESVHDAQVRSEHVATGYAGSLHAYCPRPRTSPGGADCGGPPCPPGPASNSIAWLAWHLTRSHDRNISELAGDEQLWITEGWHARFNRAADPTETGFGHSAAEAAAFRVP